jgi:hypothetical protein
LEPFVIETSGTATNLKKGTGGTVQTPDRLLGPGIKNIKKYAIFLSH